MNPAHESKRLCTQARKNCIGFFVNQHNDEWSCHICASRRSSAQIPQRRKSASKKRNHCAMDGEATLASGAAISRVSRHRPDTEPTPREFLLVLNNLNDTWVFIRDLCPERPDLVSGNRQDVSALTMVGIPETPYVPLSKIRTAQSVLLAAAEVYHD